MPDYKLGKIYKIACNATGKVYIGSTCEPTLARRLANHVGNYRCFLNGKDHYIASFDILSNNDYDITLIESYPCNTKDELHARERFHTNNIDCVNRCKNQGLLNELGHIEYHKQYNDKYRKQNRDKILEQRKEYREQNKDIIHAKNNVKHNCACGGCYTYVNKQQHIRTAKHLKYIRLATLKQCLLSNCSYEETAIKLKHL